MSAMSKEVEATLEKSFQIPGQGTLLEQIDKYVRRQQRIELHTMLDNLKQTKAKELENFPVELEKVVPQIGKKRPSSLRFLLPSWLGYDEVFWLALGDYIILALHRVQDVDFDARRGKITIQYSSREYVEAGKVKSPERIREIIQGLAFLVDREILPTDFTRFRRMDERQSSLGEMSQGEAVIIGALLKLL